MPDFLADFFLPAFLAAFFLLLLSPLLLEDLDVLPLAFLLLLPDLLLPLVLDADFVADLPVELVVFLLPELEEDFADDPLEEEEFEEEPEEDDFAEDALARPEVLALVPRFMPLPRVILVAVFSPTPLTREIRSSVDEKFPPRRRSLTMRSAITGPTPSTVCRSSTLARFTSSANAEPANRTIERKREVSKPVLRAAIWDLDIVKSASGSGLEAGNTTV